MSNMSEDIQYAGSDTRPPMLDRTDFESWQQRIRLYCLGKDNRENIMKSITEGPERARVFTDLSAEEKERMASSMQGTKLQFKMTQSCFVQDVRDRNHVNNQRKKPFQRTNTRRNVSWKVGRRTGHQFDDEVDDFALNVDHDCPPDYSKENLLATFAPQRNLTPEQIFGHNDNDRKKAEFLSSKKPLHHIDSVVQIILWYLDSGCSKLDLEEEMAPVHNSSGPEPKMMFGQNSSSLVLHQMMSAQISSGLAPQCLKMLDHSSSSLGLHCQKTFKQISSNLVSQMSQRRLLASLQAPFLKEKKGVRFSALYLQQKRNLLVLDHSHQQVSYFFHARSVVKWINVDQLIRKGNLLLDLQKLQKNPIFRISVDIRQNTNFVRAFTTSANVPSIYIQLFWNTLTHDVKTGVYSFQVNEHWLTLSVDLLRKALNVTPADSAHPFESPPAGKTNITFTRRIVPLNWLMKMKFNRLMNLIWMTMSTIYNKTSRKLPVVDVKGKGSATDVQDETTGPSVHPKDATFTKIVRETLSHADAEFGGNSEKINSETDTEILNVGSNSKQSHVALAGPNPEHMQDVTTNIPPTDKDLEILFQPMFNEYFEQSTDSEPVPMATVVNAPIVSTNTSVSTTIAQDAPSTSHSLSSLQVHPPVFPQGVAAGPTIEDTSITQADLHPSVNPVAGEPGFAQSTSGDVSLAEPNQVNQPPDHLRK
ncbi:hypothetical protein Tco_0508163 [Tanacetum coccineum]